MVGNDKARIAHILRTASRKISEITGFPVQAYYAEAPTGDHIVTTDKVMKMVCRSFGINHAQMIGKSRRREIVEARQAFSHICRHYDLGSLRKIGLCLGGRDHATIIHSVEQAEILIVTNVDFDQKYWEARDAVDNNTRIRNASEQKEIPFAKGTILDSGDNRKKPAIGIGGLI